MKSYTYTIPRKDTYTVILQLHFYTNATATTISFFAWFKLHQFPGSEPNYRWTCGVVQYFSVYHCLKYNVDIRWLQCGTYFQHTFLWFQTFPQKCLKRDSWHMQTYSYVHWNLFHFSCMSWPPAAEKLASTMRSQWRDIFPIKTIGGGARTPTKTKIP